MPRPAAPDCYLAIIADHVVDAIVITGVDGLVEWANPAFTTLTGYTMSEAAGRKPGDLLQGQDTDGEEVRRISAALRDRRRIRSEILNYTKAGAAYWVELNIAPVFDAQGVHTHFISVERDVTERMALQRDMQRALDAEQRRKEERRLLFETTEWLYTAESQEELLSVIGRCMRLLIPEADGQLFLYSNSRDALVLATTWGDRAAPDHIEPSDCWSLRKGRAYGYGTNLVDFPCNHVGETQPQPYLCIPITASGDTIGLVHLGFRRPAADRAGGCDLRAVLDARRELALLCAEQISLALANARLRDQLRDQSVRDPLTGLMNRRWFLDTMRKEIARSAMADRPMSLISIDVDHFKQFNDNHGHDAGDTVLREVGRAMADFFTGGLFPCRIGGEEFVVLAPDTDRERAFQRADGFRAIVAEMTIRYLGDVLPRTTLSAGVAAFPADATTSQALMTQADNALYAAKRGGRNRVHRVDDVETGRKDG